MVVYCTCAIKGDVRVHVNVQLIITTDKMSRLTNNFVCSMLQSIDILKFQWSILRAEQEVGQ